MGLDDEIMKSPSEKIDFAAVIEEAENGLAGMSPYELAQDYGEGSEEDRAIYREFLTKQPQRFQDEFWTYIPKLPIDAVTLIPLKHTPS